MRGSSRWITPSLRVPCSSGRATSVSLIFCQRSCLFRLRLTPRPVVWTSTCAMFLARPCARTARRSLRGLRLSEMLSLSIPRTTASKLLVATLIGASGMMPTYANLAHLVGPRYTREPRFLSADSQYASSMLLLAKAVFGADDHLVRPAPIVFVPGVAAVPAVAGGRGRCVGAGGRGRGAGVPAVPAVAPIPAAPMPTARSAVRVL